jgi:23S rRNA pseudouridine1911/1915/1917 synthase
MAVTTMGKQARTQYRVLQRFRAHTHIHLQLETGRTHQIRVHMAHINYPLIGDPLYGGRLRLPKGITPALQHSLGNIGRQALHAKKLQLCHPESGDQLEWESNLPADLQQLLQYLALDSAVQDDLT